MGMFDRVNVQCPKCGTLIEFQSKAGDCLLYEYSLYEAPPEILGDLSRAEEYCPNCKSLVAIHVVIMAQAYIKIQRNDEE